MALHFLAFSTRIFAMYHWYGAIIFPVERDGKEMLEPQSWHLLKLLDEPRAYLCLSLQRGAMFYQSFEHTVGFG